MHLPEVTRKCTYWKSLSQPFVQALVVSVVAGAMCATRAYHYTVIDSQSLIAWSPQPDGCTCQLHCHLELVRSALQA